MILNRFNRFLFNEAPPEGGGGGGGAPPANTDPQSPAPGGNEAPPADAPQRPEWFPEKYWKDGGPADVETLGKSYGELQKAFSAKNPHLAEVPADPSGYAFKPDQLPEGVQWSDDVASKMAAVFHKAQIGNTQAKAVATAFAELEAENLAAATKAYDDKITADRQALESKWGGPEAYESRKQELAAYVTEQLGEDPNDAVLFSSPRVVEFLAKEREYVKALEKQLGEDALARAKGSIAPGSSFTSSPDEAMRIMNDPAHPDHAAWQAGEDGVRKKVYALLGASE